MLIKEYRIPMPLSVEEYRIGQHYTMAETCKNETGGGEGVEIVKDEPFENMPFLGGQYTRGQYTFKIYHGEKKVPAFFRLFLPKGMFQLHEEAWNAYPYCKTVVTCPAFNKETCYVVLETFHVNDGGHTTNALQLPPEKLEKREIVHMDIGKDQTGDYNVQEDPSKFHSRMTGRGPLVGDWQKEANPLMTCYKVVISEFKWFGLQTFMENKLQDGEKQLFSNFHRQMFCWIDNWYRMTMDDIKKLEHKTKTDLDKKRNEKSNENGTVKPIVN